MSTSNIYSPAPASKLQKKPASTVHNVYYFDISTGGHFLSIPSVGNHGCTSAALIQRMIETWFTETIADCDISSKAATELEQDLELFLIKETKRMHVGGGFGPSVMSIEIDMIRLSDQEDIEMLMDFVSDEYENFLYRATLIVSADDGGDTFLPSTPPIEKERYNNDKSHMAFNVRISNECLSG
ncbi:hypothetical protein MP638_006146 [Amoeboaphelidium occidentale]|nr:hypothetical protein MP638_006146 [Amoeboaphelidium occidentale]